MKSYLIKDTTFEERLEIVRAFEEAGSCENTGMDLTEFYSDYISGRREIAEINASFHTGDDPDFGQGLPALKTGRRNQGRQSIFGKEND